ncbi:hypothetical protein SAMN04487898_105135 [Pedobacter sp. ok626]|uniref:hypothetical protein n=1 Tax=Pedobacter sp. ok626 TaxID=1761882 RepID=UPI00088454C8|nr:hypothetical protein [Pedobacter sp. ok626]SDJ95185.1 hypothetical protein SAMN04487898_105135 [Pedobacter sp. ok626]
MKKIYTILIVLLACNMLFAQQQAPKGSDKIIIKNDKSASDNFISVKLILAEKGIEIASQDKDIYQLKTGVAPVTKYGAGAYYVVFCKDNSIRLTGMFNTGFQLNMLVKDTDPLIQIVNRGMKGSLFNEAWKAMNELAATLGGDISYTGGIDDMVKIKPDPKKNDVY